MTQQTQETDYRDSAQTLNQESNYGSEGNFVPEPAEEETHFDRYDQSLWDRHLEYILTCSSFVVGIKNILQFPALTAKNGGGAFYFVYLLLVCILGVPILYLEMCIGQYVHGGPMKAWTVMPLAKGLGYGMLVLCTMISMFYNTYSAWALFYLFSSFSATLPWEINHTDNANTSGVPSTIRAANQYLYEDMLDISSGLNDTGEVQPYIAGCLFLTWVVVGVAVYWGQISIGKVAYVTGTLPTVLFLSIFCGVITLPGAVSGVKMFLTPRWQVLGKPQVWLDGVLIVLTSMGCGTGGIINLSGYCHFHSGCFRNAVLTGISNVMGCTLAGCSMFAILGVYTQIIHQPINTLNISETEIGFHLFPAISFYLENSAVWSAIFYLSIFTTGIGTQIVFISTVYTGFSQFIGVHTTLWKVSSLVFMLSVLYLIGLTTVTQAGLYVITYLDEFIHKLSIPIFCLLECLIITWLYGAQRFHNKVADMTGSSEGPFIKWMWKVICPVLLVTMLVLTILNTSCPICKVENGGKEWMEPFGWFLSLVPVLICLIYACVMLIKHRTNSKRRLKRLLQTPADWGPRRHWYEEAHGSELPDYVICSPDDYHPANALALLTANLYLPNIADIITLEVIYP